MHTNRLLWRRQQHCVDGDTAEKKKKKQRNKKRATYLVHMHHIHTIHSNLKKQNASCEIHSSFGITSNRMKRIWRERDIHSLHDYFTSSLYNLFQVDSLQVQHQQFGVLCRRAIELIYTRQQKKIRRERVERNAERCRIYLSLKLMRLSRRPHFCTFLRFYENDLSS